jgi:radical SAM-linked protein
MERLRPLKVSLGISSLRAYGLDEDLLDEIASIKATGLTFAPEAGTQRMRDVVNKNITEEDIYTTCHRVFSKGWNRVKLYFMIGQPTEDDEDVIGIAEMGRQARRIGREYQRNVNVTVSVSSHVPKPHTPFQWCAMDTMEEIERKQQILGDYARRWRFKLRRHDVRVSHLECIIGRGDARTGNLIERAWRLGARFDGWDEHLAWDIWEKALTEWEDEHHLSRHQYLGTLPLDGRLPWDHIDVGLEDGFLAQEYKRALKGRLSPPCGKPYHAKVHHSNLKEALADERKLVCYHCGVACDLTEMREERFDYLKKLGAYERPESGGDNERERAASRLRQGKAPRDFGQGRPIRYRLRYSKLAPMHLRGHLDMVRVLPRVLRRAGLPIYFSEGYSPRPVMSFGPALALGTRSFAEFADVSLCEEVDEASLLEKLAESSEKGLVFTGVKRLSDQEPGLSKLIDVVDFLVLLPSDGESQIYVYRQRCQEAMARETLPVTVTRKGKTRALDIKDLILEARVDRAGLLSSQSGIPQHRSAVHFRLQSREGPSIRPTELVQEIFGVTVQPVDIVRTRCGRLDDNGNFLDPIAESAAAVS